MFICGDIFSISCNDLTQLSGMAGLPDRVRTDLRNTCEFTQPLADGWLVRSV